MICHNNLFELENHYPLGVLLEDGTCPWVYALCDFNKNVRKILKTNQSQYHVLTTLKKYVEKARVTNNYAKQWRLNGKLSYMNNPAQCSIAIHRTDRSGIFFWKGFLVGKTPPNDVEAVWISSVVRRQGLTLDVRSWKDAVGCMTVNIALLAH